MKPLLRGHFHQAMFFITLGAGFPLILRCETFLQRVSISIYVTCALIMFGVSALYHRVNWSPKVRLIFKKLDHSGIYLMIAGSFTPFCFLVLSQNSGFNLFVTIWAVALVGIVQSLFFVNVPKYVSAIIYLIAGYLILPYIGEIRAQMGDQQVNAIIWGGVVYSIGAICYGLKKPVLAPKIFGYHEVFHVFVNVAAAIHFSVISSII